MVYGQDFDRAFERLIGHEGGFTEDPRDPGNWTGGRCGVGLCKGTKFGIAANTYSDIDIPNLTLAQAREIYYRDWWLKIGADRLGGPTAFQVWDFAVNAGMGTAKRALQRAVGVAQDGRIGEITLGAVSAMPQADLVRRFCAQRIRFYASLSKYDTYGRGWMNRVAGMLEYAAADLVAPSLLEHARAIRNCTSLKDGLSQTKPQFLRLAESMELQ